MPKLLSQPKPLAEDLVEEDDTHDHDVSLAGSWEGSLVNSARQAKATKDSVGSFRSSLSSRSPGNSRAGTHSAGGTKERPAYGTKERNANSSKERRQYGTKDRMSGGTKDRSAYGTKDRISGVPSSSGGRRKKIGGSHSLTLASRSPYGTKGRTDSGSPGSRGHRLNRSDSGSRAESDSDDDLEDRIDEVPEHLMGAIPLHLREAVILKKGQPHAENQLELLGEEEKPPTPKKQAPKRRPLPVPPAPPNLEVLYSRRMLCCACWATVVWGLAAMILLSVFAWRLHFKVNMGTHRYIADSALYVLQVKVAASLEPALSAVRALEIGVRSGLFNTTDIYSALDLVVVPELRSTPALRHMKVAGLAPRAVFYRPGWIHDDGLPAVERAPLVSTVECISILDPVSCLALNSSSTELVPQRGLEMAFGWDGPEYLTEGPQGERLEPQEWVLALHLVAQGDVGFAESDTKRIAMNVAVDVHGLSQIARAAAPNGGHVYVYSATNGMLLAGSDWTPGAYADSITGQLVYDRIWSLPGQPWSSAITPEAAASMERTEIWHGVDLVVLQPLSAGGLSTSSESALRVAVFVPRDIAVRPILMTFVQSSLGLVVAPFVIAAMWILGIVLNILFWKAIAVITAALTSPRELDSPRENQQAASMY